MKLLSIAVLFFVAAQFSNSVAAVEVQSETEGGDLCEFSLQNEYDEFMQPEGFADAIPQTVFQSCQDLRLDCLRGSKCPGGGHNLEDYCVCLNGGKISKPDGTEVTCNYTFTSQPRTCEPDSSNDEICPKPTSGNKFPNCKHKGNPEVEPSTLSPQSSKAFIRYLVVRGYFN